MMKKIKRIKTPYFLGDIVVKEVDVGTSPPLSVPMTVFEHRTCIDGSIYSFSKPMLKELTPEGEASFEVEVHYKGEFKIRIATTATIPTGFSKPYKINLELVAILKGLHGNMVFQIKKPPSNRIWYSFTRMPEIDLLVEPVVSDRKIQLGMVLKAIEKQIREAVSFPPYFAEIELLKLASSDRRLGGAAEHGRLGFLRHSTSSHSRRYFR
jgi:hypothetical protein